MLKLLVLLFKIIEIVFGMPISNDVNLNEQTTRLDPIFATSTTKPTLVANSLASNSRNSIKYNLVRLDSNSIRHLNIGDNIIIECPVDHMKNYQSVEVESSNKHYPGVSNNNAKRESQRQTPVLLTSWYKNQLKINQFNLDDSIELANRVRIYDRKLKIRKLIKSDSGVYSCEIITGNGLSVKSNNFTLKVTTSVSNNLAESEDDSIETIKPLNQENEENNYETNDYDSNEDLSSSGEKKAINEYESRYSKLLEYGNYIKGEAPSFQEDDEHEIEKDFRLLEKGQVQFNCISRGVPTPQIIWLKNGQIMSEEEYGIIRNVMSLKLKDLHPTDSGNYTCQVSNQFGKLNRTFTLKVLEQLKFVDNEPSNQTVNLNQQVVFKCQVENPFSSIINQPIYQTKIKWFFRVDESKFNTMDKSSIFISNQSSILQIDGETFYQLEPITSSSSNSKENGVNLLNKFLFKTNPSATNDLTGSKSSHLSSLFISNPTKSKSSKSNIYQLGDGSLVIEKAALINTGYYLCLANNSNGYNYRKAYLNVLQKNGESTVAQTQSSEAPIVDLLNQQQKQFYPFTNFKSTPNIINKEQSILSTPLIFIISISSMAIIIIVCLLYFYNKI